MKRISKRKTLLAAAAGAWAIQLFNGNTSNGGANGKTTFSNFVWPVRGGQ